MVGITLYGRRNNRLFFFLFIAALVLLIVSLALFVRGIAKAFPNPNIINFDPKFVASLEDLGRRIPAGEPVAVYTNRPYVTYLTRHSAWLPYQANSTEDLMKMMRERNTSYFILFGGRGEMRLQNLSHPEGLAALRQNMTLIVNHSTGLNRMFLFAINSTT